MSGPSFAYDLQQTLLDERHLEAKCIVHFRPKENWNGNGYGFDWMRLGDTGVFGDQKKYEEIVCKQYKSVKVLETDVNAYSGTFEKDALLYKSLMADYRPMNIPWRSKKNDAGAVEFEQYFCSWLSLYPATAGMFMQEISPFFSLSKASYKNTKAELRLYLEIEEEPERLEFEAADSLEITPKTITSGLTKGNGFWDGGKTITVECKKPLLNDEAIKVYAIKKNPLTDREEKKLAGKLLVWSNHCNKRKKASIVMVEVTTPALKKGDNPMNGKSLGQQAIFENYFAQALIAADVKIEKLDMSADADFKKYHIKDGKILAYYEDPTKTPPGFIDIEDFLYTKLKAKLKNDNKSETLYDNSFIAFYLAVAGGSCWGNGKISGLNGYSSGRYVVLFPTKNNQTAAHEFYHSFELQHSFSNYDLHKKEAFCTFKYCQTENLMDYSHHINETRYSLWHWQWNQANGGIKQK